MVCTAELLECCQVPITVTYPPRQQSRPWQCVASARMVQLLSLALIGMAHLTSAAAQTSLIDSTSLPRKRVYGVAYLTPLAVSDAGTPVVALLDLQAGDVVPPHATASGLRLLTVLRGNLSWGDGKTIDQAKETVYPAGSILTLPAGVYHWAAARSDDVRIQLVLLDADPTPAVQEQMQ